ncbi:MAG: UDP-glucose 4-epimerase GalE [Bacteroidetes bacterium]|jgi:UDP-glucose 4-epimerase|nr:UDP-glucose 4-epimerase GalE [Bacteroidota bacterium]NBX63379.1 UDP-glucose 4-epimerase GalE [Bacteroidota bacterium]
MITKRNILVTGGLGFIGSHTVLCLNEAGYTPIIVDNLHNSRIEVLDALEELLGYRPTYIQGDVNDGSLMMKVFNEYTPSAVIHFAAHKAVGESVEKPLMYYQNNVVGLISLLEVMKSTGCVKMVFSSSCTVYGEPESVPVRESTPTRPAASPYGATKQMAEVILKDNAWCEVQCLRYFNPVGAHPSAKIGELPLGIPNNLIPYLTQTVAGIREKLTVHGGDYPTADGTCIRDYIHVMDLAEAHVAAIDRLFNPHRLVESQMGDPSLENFEVFNIGTGVGYSVLEVIAAFESATGEKVNYAIGDRRAGDVIAVWADTTKVNNVLGWSAKRDLSTMMKDAWHWQQRC